MIQLIIFLVGTMTRLVICREEEIPPVESLHNNPVCGWPGPAPGVEAAVLQVRPVEIVLAGLAVTVVSLGVLLQGLCRVNYLGAEGTLELMFL